MPSAEAVILHLGIRERTAKMLCSLSGTVPEEPVISLKSGHLYEKRLIEKHIETTGRDPVTREEATVADLLPVKSACSRRCLGVLRRLD